MAKSTKRPTTTKTKSKPSSKPRFIKAKDAAQSAPKSKSKTPATRSDLNKPGDVAIDRLPEPHRSIARAADAMIRGTAPKAVSIVKWGNACYYLGDRAFASLIQTRTGINLALPGIQLADPHKLLEGTGKTMRHVKLHDVALASDKRVAALVRAAKGIGFERM